MRRGTGNPNMTRGRGGRFGGARGGGGGRGGSAGRGGSGGITGGPLLTDHLRDLDMELQLLKRKREIYEQEQNMLDRFSNSTTNYTDQYSSNKNSKNRNKRQYDNKQPFYTHSQQGPSEPYSSFADYADAYESGPGPSNTRLQGVKRQPVWENQNPSPPKRFNAPQRINPWQNQDGSQEYRAYNQNPPQPKNFSTQTRSFMNPKPGIGQRIRNKYNPPVESKNFRPSKVTKPNQKPIPKTPIYRPSEETKKLIEETNKLIAHTNRIVGGGQNPSQKKQNPPQKRQHPQGQNPLPIAGNIRKKLEHDNILRPNRQPFGQMKGRLELALGMIVKSVKDLCTDPTTLEYFTLPFIQRVIKYTIRMRIKDVMMNKRILSVTEVVDKYREKYPKETDIELMKIAQDANEYNRKNRGFLQLIDTADPEEFFRKNLNKILHNKLEDLFKDLKTMTANRVYNIETCVQSFPKHSEVFKENEGKDESQINENGEKSTEREKDIAGEKETDGEKDMNREKDTDGVKVTNEIKDTDVEKDTNGKKDIDEEKDTNLEKDTDMEKDTNGKKDIDGEKDTDMEKDTNGKKDIDGEKDTNGKKYIDGEKVTNVVKDTDMEKDTKGNKDIDGKKDTNVVKDIDMEKDTNGKKDIDGEKVTNVKKDTNVEKDTEEVKETDMEKYKPNNLYKEECYSADVKNIVEQLEIKSAKTKHYVEFMDQLIEQRLPYILPRFKETIMAVLCTNKQFLSTKALIVLEMKEKLRKAMEGDNTITLETTSGSAKTAASGKPATTATTGSSGVAKAAKPATFPGKPAPAAAKPAATKTPAKPATTAAAAKPATPVKPAIKPATTLSSTPATPVKEAEKSVPSAPSTPASIDIQYVKLIGRPALPARAVIYEFLNTFKPASIKKHKSINNLLVIGFTDKEGFEKILAANESVVGDATIIIKASEQVANTPVQNKTGQQGNKTPVRSKATDEVNTTPQSKTTEQQKAEVPNQENIETPATKDTTKDITPAKTAGNKSGNDQNNSLTEDILSELDTQITDLLSSMRKSDEEEKMDPNAPKKSTDVEKMITDTELDKEIAELTQESDDRKAELEKTTETKESNAKKDLDTIMEVDDENKKAKAIEEIGKTVKESGRATPTRSSSRLANVTPSTIKTRRASRLANN